MNILATTPSCSGSGGGTNPTPDLCNTIETTAVVLCDPVTGSPVIVTTRIECVPATGATTTTIRYSDAQNNTVVPNFPLGNCSNSNFDQLAICDTDVATGNTLGVYIVRVVHNVDGTFTTTTVNVKTGAPYVPVGEPRFCGDGIDIEILAACDNGTPLVVEYAYNGGALVGVSYRTPVGAPYVPTGPVTLGGCTTTCDAQSVQYEIACDNTDPASPTQIVVKYATSCDGDLSITYLDRQYTEIAPQPAHSAVTIGLCVTEVTPTRVCAHAVNLASGIYAPTLSLGDSSWTAPANLRSVSVMTLRGSNNSIVGGNTVKIIDSNGTVSHLIRGIQVDWTIDIEEELPIVITSIECEGDSAAYVSWTVDCV
jgi:hypothetical protein